VKVRIIIDNLDETPDEFVRHSLNREKHIPPKSRVTLFIGPLDSSEYLFLPTVTTEGEREIDWHNGVRSSGDTIRQGADAGIGIGMAVTAHWYMELDLQYRKSAGTGTALDSIEWENILQIAEPNAWPIDVSLESEIERPQDTSEGPSIRIGPLLQK